MEIKREVTPSAMKRWKEAEHYKHKDSGTMPSIQEMLSKTSAAKHKLPNYTLARWPQSEPAKLPIQKLYSKLPSFVYEFIGEEPAPAAFLQEIKRPVVSKTMPPKTPQKRRYVNPQPKETSVDKNYRELSVYEFRYKKRQKNIQRAYKPYIIEISPRAKMTVYSNLPIYNLMQQRDFKDRKPRPRRATSVASERAAVDKDNPEEAIEVPRYATTFGEMLKRAKNIVDKQFSSFNNV